MDAVVVAWYIWPYITASKRYKCGFLTWHRLTNIKEHIWPHSWIWSLRVITWLTYTTHKLWHQLHTICAVTLVGNDYRTLSFDYVKSCLQVFQALVNKDVLGGAESPALDYRNLVPAPFPNENCVWTWVYVSTSYMKTYVGFKMMGSHALPCMFWTTCLLRIVAVTITVSGGVGRIG